MIFLASLFFSKLSQLQSSLKKGFFIRAWSKHSGAATKIKQPEYKPFKKKKKPSGAKNGCSHFAYKIIGSAGALSRQGLRCQHACLRPKAACSPPKELHDRKWQGRFNIQVVDAETTKVVPNQQMEHSSPDGITFHTQLFEKQRPLTPEVLPLCTFCDLVLCCCYWLTATVGRQNLSTPFKISDAIAGFLNIGSPDTWGHTCFGDCPVHCRMTSSLSGLDALDASSTQHCLPVCENKDVFACQMSPRERSGPWLSHCARAM